MIQVIHRAAKILGSFAPDPMAGKTLTELARLIEVEAPTCANIVKTLVDLGYLEPLPAKKGYRLGPEPWRLTSRGPYLHHVAEAALPLMQAFVEEHRESCILSVLQGPRRVKVAGIDCNRLLKAESGEMVEENGIRFATSRVHLAHMEAAERKAWVDRCGFPGQHWDEIADAEALERACERVRKESHALSVNVQEGLVGLAFPVFEKGAVRCAFGIFLPQSRWTKDVREPLTESGLRCAKKITDRLS